MVKSRVWQLCNSLQTQQWLRGILPHQIKDKDVGASSATYLGCRPPQIITCREAVRTCEVPPTYH